MSRSALTGSRIRELRVQKHMKQATLAKSAGISASYLNLIEHNRRRIGGKLLLDIARLLEVDSASLTEGAEAALLADLGDAAALHPGAGAETDRMDDFARRYPGWAGLIAGQSRRAATLERNVQALTDRLAHDPFLSTSLHDMLSAVTAIRAATAILSDTDDIDPEWQARFLRNIRDDSHRLGDSAEALVRYLDDPNPDAASSTPQEELEQFLEVRGYHLAPLERALPPSPESFASDIDMLRTDAGRSIAVAHFARYLEDARKMPLGRFREALARLDFDPGRVAGEFGVTASAVMRRWATLPANDAGRRPGLVIVDGSGAALFRKPTEGFSLPRFASHCPLWPIFTAMTRPLTPIRQIVELGFPASERFLTYSISEPKLQAGFDAPTIFETTMLILPENGVRPTAETALPVGPSCRICPRSDCLARREPSIVSAEVDAA